MTVELLVFDTETADISGGICDIAIAALDGDLNTVWEMESLIDPERPISPSAMGIHHITNQMVADEPTLAQWIGINGNPFIDNPGVVYGGHNVQFDLRVLGAQHLPDSYRTIDTLKLSRNLWPDMENHKLQTLRYTFDLDAGTAHRAMGDVNTCVSLFRKIASDHQCGLQGLLDLGRKPLSLETVMPFGKHKGDKLKALPLSYVRWLIDNATELDPDLREALASRLN